MEILHQKKKKKTRSELVSSSHVVALTLVTGRKTPHSRRWKCKNTDILHITFLVWSVLIWVVNFFWVNLTLKHLDFPTCHHHFNLEPTCQVFIPHQRDSPHTLRNIALFWHASPTAVNPLVLTSFGHDRSSNPDLDSPSEECLR